MLEFPQPAITKSRTAEIDATSRHERGSNLNRITLAYNRTRLSGRVKGTCISGSPVFTVVRARMCRTSACRAKLISRLLTSFVESNSSGDRLRQRGRGGKLLRYRGTATHPQKYLNYFFLDSFFDSPSESLDSFVVRLDSPGRYSSCSAAAKAFSNPTISSPGRSVSKDSTSLRSWSSE